MPTAITEWSGLRERIAQLPEFLEYVRGEGAIFGVTADLALDAWTVLAAQLTGPVLRELPAPPGLSAFYSERYGQVTVTVMFSSPESGVMTHVLRKGNWTWTLYVPEILFGHPKYVTAVAQLATGQDFGERAGDEAA